MKKILRVLLSASLVLLVAFTTFNATLDISHSITEETSTQEVEEKTKNIESENDNDKTEENSHVLFYSGMILLIFVVVAMLFVFLSKDEEN